MKHSILFKFLALFLATVFLVITVGSTAGIICMIGMNFYDETFDEVYESEMWAERRSLAVDLAYTYATLNLGNIPEEYFQHYYGYEWKNSDFQDGYYFYSIFDGNGTMVESTVVGEPQDAAFYEIELTDVTFRKLITDPATADPSKGMISDNYFDANHDCYVEVNYQIEVLPYCTVQLYVLDGAYSYDAPWQILQDLYAIRYHLFWVFGASLLLFIICAVWLCCAAARKSGSDEVRAGGLNRLPLDLYTASAFAIVFMLCALAYYLVTALIYDMPQLMMYLLLLVGSIGSLVVVCLLFAWAAQLKTPNHYWLKNTILGRVLMLVYRFLCWVGKGFRWTFRAMHSLLRLLPVIWQWLLTAALMVIIPLLFIIFVNAAWYPWSSFWAIMFLVSLAANVGITIYGGYCFGVLMKGAKRMSQGNLSKKISTKYLFGSFRDFALHLNALSEAASLAAEQQMRSERMKTELITNVSHDIKTPLTSIINFVDLLQKTHTEEQKQEYLEVLSRQSAQMKKLIEDLMELSKANSGNISVNLQKMDAVEAVNQALGEFSDKLDAVGLTPVFRQPEHPVYITADGHHVWRVLFNLLTNVVKYALPGTRLYIDVMQLEDQVILSVKNISRTELNISAEELMERFVQGDASRKSEGSGLGLNIAKSLMEVQHGQLQLLLDGDLFKVTLTFPAAQ